jgi:NADH dehydrogenase [ubiquinone] 1 alpha subcomplex assembly factor 5
MTAPNAIFDKTLLRDRRARAAASASEHDFLLHRVADDFASRLEIVSRSFPRVLNLGAHNGVLSDRIAQLPTIGEIIDYDGVSFASEGSGRQRIVGDEEALPFAPGSLDLIVSGLALQHVNDLPGTLVQIRRALKPDGLLLGNLLGGETLKELREAWIIAEDEIAGGASPRVAPFGELRDLGSLLQRAGFALPVADSDTVTVAYATPLALMREIKAMGASNVLTARRRVPVTRTLLMRACEVYADRFARADGRIEATFEIITLTAWAPHESQQQPLEPGSATARLADVLGDRTPDLKR